MLRCSAVNNRASARRHLSPNPSYCRVLALLQGALFTTGKPGQSSWRIWANYQLTIGDKLSEEGKWQLLMRDDVFSKAVLLHLTSTNVPFNTSTTDSISHVHRLRVLQSGDVFRWVSEDGRVREGVSGG